MKSAKIRKGTLVVILKKTNWNKKFELGLVSETDFQNRRYTILTKSYRIPNVPEDELLPLAQTSETLNFQRAFQKNLDDVIATVIEEIFKLKAVLKQN